MFHLLDCFLCIPCNTNLLLAVLLVVTSILVVHFDISFCLDESWGEVGERKLQEGGNEPDFD